MAVHELLRKEEAGKYRDGISELIPLWVKCMEVQKVYVDS
jgi:hypothetical protein